VTDIRAILEIYQIAVLFTALFVSFNADRMQIQGTKTSNVVTVLTMALLWPAFWFGVGALKALETPAPSVQE
jgi:hypothetical protein